MIYSIILQKMHPFCDGHGRTCKILFANDRGVVTGRAREPWLSHFNF